MFEAAPHVDVWEIWTQNPQLCQEGPINYSEKQNFAHKIPKLSLEFSITLTEKHWHGQ